MRNRKSDEQKRTTDCIGKNEYKYENTRGKKKGKWKKVIGVLSKGFI